jgi:hypothetical protein
MLLNICSKIRGSSIVEDFIRRLLKTCGIQRSVGCKDVKIIALIDTEGNEKDSKHKRNLADLIVEDDASRNG